ncbi:MAG: hypothetical protein ACT4PT_05235 [Methanobacteriota archaeon]
MDWLQRLRNTALPLSVDGFDLLYHASVRPAAPPEYIVAGMVGLTFRLHRRPQGGHVYVTTIDLAGVARIASRLGLRFEEALAFVDSHEKVHIALQLEGVGEETEEEMSRFVDAVWLSLEHPRAGEKVRTGEFGLVTRIEPDLWEAILVNDAYP